MSGTHRIGDVEYGDYAFEHMRGLYARAQRTLDGEIDDPKLVQEAATIHEFHRQFPGLVMKDAPNGR